MIKAFHIFSLRLLNVILTFFIANSLIFAQTVEIPVIEVVTVDHTDNKPVLSWTINDPGSISGYSIKRLIYEYDFVVPMTYQTIDTINDPFIFNYKDESSVFGEAMPDERLEKYFIIAFKINTSDTLYSLGSIKHQTVFLQTSFEYCEKRNKLIWNKYLGWGNEFEKYDIYCKLNTGTYSLIASTESQTDTVFYHNNINLDSDYTYFIKAIRSDLIESLSNESSVNTQSVDLPDFLNSDSIIVDHSDNVHLFFEFDTDSDVDSYVLYKYNDQTSDYDSVNYHQGNHISTIEFQDIEFEFERLNYYFIAAKDQCYDNVFVSDTMSNIFVEVETANDESKKNFIQWEDGASFPEFDIYRCIENNCMLTASLYDYNYTDDIQDIFRNQFQGEITSGRFCYFIECSNLGYLSRSNIACVDQGEASFIANSFNPFSSIEENRTFKPKIAFISDFNLIIYGNLGNKIFETNDPNVGWDGKFPNGSLAPRASYLYFISYKNAFGRQIKKRSYVNLLY